MNQSEQNGGAPTLAKLREPFGPNHISKLPKPTKQQTEAVRADFKKGIRCTVCGAWHHPDVIHLDYVGHAAATDRLLDTDLEWSWEPLATDERGLPAFDENGGLWIKLTVLGVTRLGYGSADGKSGGDAKKEIIGDAIRNAGMRFGMALDLWHKGDLHADAEDEDASGRAPKPKPEKDAPFPQGPCRNKTELKEKGREFWREVEGCGDPDELAALLSSGAALTKQLAEALPDWWNGGTKDGEPYDGLGTIIACKQTDLAATATEPQDAGDWRDNPLIGG